MQNEGRRILHDEALQVSCTCVRVPVYRCHSESIYVETETEVSLDAIRQAAEECPGLVLNEAPYPTPKECTDSDAVVIGRRVRMGHVSRDCICGAAVISCARGQRPTPCRSANGPGEWIVEERSVAFDSGKISGLRQ